MQLLEPACSFSFSTVLSVGDFGSEFIALEEVIYAQRVGPAQSIHLDKLLLSSLLSLWEVSTSCSWFPILWQFLME